MPHRWSVPPGNRDSIGHPATCESCQTLRLGSLDFILKTRRIQWRKQKDLVHQVDAYIIYEWEWPAHGFHGQWRYMMFLSYLGLCVTWDMLSCTFILINWWVHVLQVHLRFVPVKGVERRQQIWIKTRGDLSLRIPVSPGPCLTSVPPGPEYLPLLRHLIKPLTSVIRSMRTSRREGLWLQGAPWYAGHIVGSCSVYLYNM